MKAATEETSEFGAETEFGATPNSDGQRTFAEEKAVKCFALLQHAEGKCDDAGKEFGQAMIELREEIKASGDRDFIKRLKELGISYEKARYWMAKFEGKPTDRHKEGSPKTQEMPAFDWGAAIARLDDLKDDVCMLKKSRPEVDGQFIESLSALAENLGHELVPKDGGNNV